MDLITHTIVGSASYKIITQKEISIEDPGVIAAAIGAIIPDIDIITHLLGDIPYFKYHRGATHSIIGIVTLSLLNGFFLSLFFQMSFLSLFLFTLMGSVTHILLDTLNSYGAMVFWPFSKQKLTFNLLVFIEPFMIIPCLAIIFINTGPFNTIPNILFSLVLIYFSLRYLSKVLLRKKLKKVFSRKKAAKIVIFPAFASIFHWDYILEDDHEIVLGRASITLNNIQIKRLLKKVKGTPVIKKALFSKLGQLFTEFTPYYHLEHIEQEGKHLIKFFDLRYLVKEGFVNSAILKLTQKGKIKEAYFQPYSESRKIPIKE